MNRRRLPVISLLFCSVVACLIVFPSAIAAQTALNAVHLTVEHAATPLGIDAEHPRLSWQLEASGRDILQTSYRIVVSTSDTAAAKGQGDVWDSGEVASSDSLDRVYDGPSLRSGERYFWSVRIHDNRGHGSGWAKSSWWEMGLLRPSDWSGARWITSAPAAAAPRMRRGFQTDKAIKRARLYISAGGYYVASINGQRVGNAVLDPGFTAYNKRILYSTYDVTTLLRRGRNAIGVRLGRGFYAIDTSHQILWWNRVAWLAHSPILLVKLDVAYADHTHKIVVSGSDWKTHAGPTTSDSMYRGETYDARLAMPGWDHSDYNASLWSSAVEVAAPTETVQAQMAQPIRVIKTWTPSSITQPKPGVYVYKFPVMLAGWVRLKVSGAMGTTVVMSLGEKLQHDGTVDNNGDPGITPGKIQTYSYTLSGNGVETWEPQFSYAGFQYVQVEGFPGTPTKSSIVAREVHSDVPTTGSFSSSNILLNEIHAICQRAVLNNSYSIPTDTPTYEKRGWAGDTLLDSAEAIDNFGMQRFYTKWLYDLADTQDAKGNVSDIAPSWEAGSAASWGSVFVVLPWRLYMDYGDQRLVATHYDAMKSYVDFLSTKATNHLIKGFYGDWVSPTMGESPWPPEGPDLLASANYYRDALLLSKMAGVMGRLDDVATYTKLAAAIKQSFSAVYLDDATDVYRTEKKVGYRQTSNVVPLEFGMAAPEQTSAVVSNLVADVHQHQDHLNTGAFGTSVLLPALTKNGQVNLAYAIATQTTYPSWGDWIRHGATTTIESWNYAKSRSLDHAFLGTVDDWLFRYLAGIQPAAPGYKEISIRPYVPGGLHRVSASMDTPQGVVSSSWMRGPRAEVILKVVIPANATATVWVPGRATPVQTGSGSYTYVGRVTK